ncbi:MAG: fibronectin-binding protein [Leptospiraceae bacterium]|nr:fibronectin-binding protein [Leptospiraceae bacterium]
MFNKTFLFSLVLFSATFLMPGVVLAQDLSGTYSVQGTNPDGSNYSGTCIVSRISGDRYRFRWSVGNAYEGEGTLEGIRISVDWGDSTPVIYTLLPDGSLDGIWAGGKASETLTPK